MTMNDLSTRMRESLSDVRLADPVERVVARGRSLRRRRWSISALAAVGVASLAVVLTVNGPVGPTSAVPLELAAWSVETNPDHTVTVTIRELNDADLLAETLSKEGVRARVQFVPLGAGTQVGCWQQEGKTLDSADVFLPPTQVGRAEVVTIAPAAMPAGSVLNFVVFRRTSDGEMSTYMALYDGEPGLCVPLTDEQVRAEVDARP